VVGSEDGTVSKYSFETNTLEEVLTRCSLPIRDVALSPDGNWVAVASDELTVKIVNTQDMMRVMHLREQQRAVKHVTFDRSGSALSVSCADGIVYVYSLSSEEPQLIKKVDGLIKTLETDAEASSRAIWHPDGRAFGAPTGTRDFQVVSREDWEHQRVFKDSHNSDITAAAWSPNGALLVTTSIDRKMCIWDTKNQKVLHTVDGVRATVLAMMWHPKQNILSYTNNDGELYIHTDFVPEESVSMLQKQLQPAPFIHDPLRETSGNAQRQPNGVGKDAPPAGRGRAASIDSLDDILGYDRMSDVQGADDFVVDDDGEGYAEINGNGKRTNGHLPSRVVSHKRPTYDAWQPRVHQPFQPGSTPWRGNRKYLCLNLTGFVWTVDQETHNTVTVEFYDRDFHKDYHFTDAFLYDKACLNENGALFSCPPKNTGREAEPAQLYYRPHETWTTRSDWRYALPQGETVVSIALSDNFIVCSTSANYVRVYSLFGVPLRVYRQKSFPAVTCAAFRDYVLTIGNGPVNGDSRAQLLYTIENVKRDETYQSEDLLPLPADAELRNVFFSDKGDPCIYDTTGTLLTLLHWRTAGQAKWTPLLDTTQLDRLASGKKEETYWPVAVAQERFHCIILKGGDKYPYFPRPLLTDFEFRIPLGYVPTATGAEDEEDTTPSLTETQQLEQSYALNSTLLSLLSDLVDNTRASSSTKVELAKKTLDVDKSLLQLLAAECREGEDRGMKALEIVGLMRDQSGKMLEAAVKVARRYGQGVLAERIGEVAERRVVGLVDEDD
jgi:chromosome transmission fidelity protein 4